VYAGPGFYLVHLASSGPIDGDNGPGSVDVWPGIERAEQQLIAAITARWGKPKALELVEL
jgi:hypothetical protein